LRGETVQFRMSLDSETTARRVQGYARTMYRWAMSRGSVDTNPFEGVPAPGQEVQRDRVLTGIEIGMVWRAAGKLAPPYGPFVRFLLLTLQRREEVAGMVWGEISDDLTRWTLPQERAKNGKAHLNHLAEPAREILRQLGAGGSTDLVFGVGAGKPLTSFSFIKRQLDVLIAEERGAGCLGKAPEPMPAWRMHDFRRTGVTVLAEMGFAPHVADRLLNHVRGTIKGVAAIYQRGQFLPERQRALDAWAVHVLACAADMPAKANVVPLPGRRARKA
ncbi:site-specific integrase, partial [Roseomonas sp. NAR14]